MSFLHSMNSKLVRHSFTRLAGVALLLFAAALTAQESVNLDSWSDPELINSVHKLRGDAVGAASLMAEQDRSAFLTKLADLAKNTEKSPVVRFNAALAIGEINESGDKPCSAAAAVMQDLLAEGTKQPDYVLLAALLGMARHASSEGITDANKAIIVDSLVGILDPALAKKRNITPEVVSRLQSLAVKGLAALKSVSGSDSGTRVLDTFVRIAKDSSSDLALLDNALLGIAGIDLKAAADSGVDVKPLADALDTAYSTMISKEISMIEMQVLRGQVSSSTGGFRSGGMGMSGPSGPGGPGGMGGMGMGMGMGMAGSATSGVELEMAVAQCAYDIDCLQKAVESLSKAAGDDEELARALKKLSDRAVKTKSFIAYGDLALDDDFDPNAKENRIKNAGKNEPVNFPITIVTLKAFLENQKWDIRASSQKENGK